MNEKQMEGAYLQRKAKIKTNIGAWALISPYILIFVVFTLVPVVMGVVFSFMKYNPYQTDDSTWVWFNNYKMLFSNNPISMQFWNSFGTMFVFAIVAVPCLIVIPLALAYLINMHPPGYKIYRAILYLPSVLSISVAGIIFCCMFQGDNGGLINSWLNNISATFARWFGTESTFEPIKWMSGEPWKSDFLRWFVMLLLSIWWQTGTNFVILSGALRDVPKSLYEACEMDGGSRWHQITRVTLPNIKSSVNICIFTTLIGYLNLFGQVYVINDKINEATFVAPMQFIQYYLQGGAAYASQTGYFCACAIVFGLIVMLFSITQQYVTGEKTRKSKWGKHYARYHSDQNYMAQVATNTEVSNG